MRQFCIWPVSDSLGFSLTYWHWSMQWWLELLIMMIHGMMQLNGFSSAFSCWKYSWSCMHMASDVSSKKCGMCKWCGFQLLFIFFLCIENWQVKHSYIYQLYTWHISPLKGDNQDQEFRFQGDFTLLSPDPCLHRREFMLIALIKTIVYCRFVAKSMKTGVKFVWCSVEVKHAFIVWGVKYHLKLFFFIFAGLILLWLVQRSS